MADENVVQPQEQPVQSKYGLDDFDIGVDQGSGELIMTPRPKQPQPEQSPEIQTQEQPTPGQPDFSQWETKFNSISDMQQRQNQVLQQLGQAILAIQQPDSATLAQEQLGEVFGDPEKGVNFLNTLTGTIEKLIDKKFSALQPLVQQSQLQTELNWAQSQPDFQEFAPAINHILGINPGVTIPQAYNYAKQQGWRTPVKQAQKQPDNVSNINQRRNLPPPTNSSNASLQSKDVKNVKDALELALEQLAVGE